MSLTVYTVTTLAYPLDSEAGKDPEKIDVVMQPVSLVADNEEHARTRAIEKHLSPFYWPGDCIFVVQKTGIVLDSETIDEAYHDPCEGKIIIGPHYGT